MLVKTNRYVICPSEKRLEGKRDRENCFMFFILQSNVGIDVGLGMHGI